MHGARGVATNSPFDLGAAVLHGGKVRRVGRQEQQPSRSARGQAASRTHVAEVVARYLVEYAKSRLACSTLDGYQSALKNHLIPKLGIYPFSVAIEVSRSRMLDVELV